MCTCSTCGTSVHMVLCSCRKCCAVYMCKYVDELCNGIMRCVFVVLYCVHMSIVLYTKCRSMYVLCHTPGVGVCMYCVVSSTRCRCISEV